MLKLFKSGASVHCALTSILCLCVTVPAGASIPKVSIKSPLYQLIEEYCPDYTGRKSDPLHNPQMKSEADEAVKLGWDYFNRSDHQTALKRFLVAIRMDDTNAAAYFGVAYVCSVDNNIDEAILFYREALKYQKHYAPIYANLGRALLMKDPKSNEALGLLQQAIQIDPKFAESYLTYARYLSEQGDWKSAGEQIDKAIAVGRKIDSPMVELFKQHGIILKQ